MKFLTSGESRHMGGSCPEGIPDNGFSFFEMINDIDSSVFA